MTCLQLLVKFTTVDKETLEKTKLLKILEKLTKKGGQECKDLSQRIIDNAAVATKRKADGSQSPSSPKPSETLSNPSKMDPLNMAQRKEVVIGSKRPREGETPSLPATKRIITKPIPQSSKPLAVQAAERRRAAEAAQAQAAKLVKSTANGMAAASGVVKPKPVVSVPKPQNNIFAALQSASKKPGTSNADRAAAAKEKPAANPRKETSPPPGNIPAKPAFSFMEALADMSKPKEVEQKKAAELPPETEEERMKRLRKEQRRRLRVSWKPDDSLVETRMFTHDPDEEVGHADSMMRDVDDVGGEGRMLKLHMDKKGLDDEEEDGEELEAYVAPIEVDLSDIPEVERQSNYIKTGGTLAPESPSGKAQDLHEQNTLMVVYAIPSDVPTSPKEPPQTSDEEDYQPTATFGEPVEETRSREAKVLAARAQSQTLSSTSGIDVNAVLQSLRLQQLPQPQQQAAITPDIQRALALLGQPQHQQQQPVAQPTPGLDLNKYLALYNQMQAQQQQAQPQYTAPSAQTAATPNVSALLAQMTQQAQQPQVLPLGLQANPNPSPGNENDSSRKHSRNDSGNDNDGDYSRGKNGNKKKKPASSGTGDEVKPYNYKTLVCSFWQKGQCVKGDNCTYRHDNEV